MENKNEHVKISYKEYPPKPLIPNRLWPGVISNYKVIDTKFGKSILLIVSLTSPEYPNLEISGLVGTQISPKSKLFNWLTNLGVTLEKGMELDFKDLFEGRLKGMPVQISVTSYVNKDGVEQNSFKDIFASSPMSASQPAPVAQPAPAVAPVAAPVAAPVQPQTQPQPQTTWTPPNGARQVNF